MGKNVLCLGQPGPRKVSELGTQTDGFKSWPCHIMSYFIPLDLRSNTYKIEGEGAQCRDLRLSKYITELFTVPENIWAFIPSPFLSLRLSSVLIFHRLILLKVSVKGLNMKKSYTCREEFYPAIWKLMRGLSTQNYASASPHFHSFVTISKLVYESLLVEWEGSRCRRFLLHKCYVMLKHQSLWQLKHGLAISRGWRQMGHRKSLFNGGEKVRRKQSWVVPRRRGIGRNNKFHNPLDLSVMVVMKSWGRWSRGRKRQCHMEWGLYHVFMRVYVLCVFITTFTSWLPEM